MEESDRVGLVQLVLKGLLLLSFVGFFVFVSTDHGPYPRWPGVLFIVTGVYCVVFFVQITRGARMARDERESRPIVEMFLYGAPVSSIPPSLAPWVMAVLTIGMGTAMLLY